MANESADQNLPTRAPIYSSAWVDEHTISIAGKAVEEKSNEITAIPDVHAGSVMLALQERALKNCQEYVDPLSEARMTSVIERLS